MSRRETNIVRITILIAALCLAYVYGVEPTLSGWQKSEAEIETLSLKLSKMKSIVAEQDSMNALFAELAEKTMLSAAENPSGKLLESIAEITADSGMAVNGVSPLPDRNYDFYRVSSARLDIECGLEEMVRLVLRFRNSPEAIEVTRMEIGPRDRDTDTLRGYLEVSMTTLEGGGDETAEDIR